MFKVKSVTDCPYTRKSNGIVRMSSDLIAQLAAAVGDKDEWAIVLQGERRQRGFEVEITGYRVPPQTRSSGHVELPEMDNEPEDVMVIHSHHRLGAFFSGTDTNSLNPRFPVSIVVADGKNKYLGFDYKGTGKVTLSCGAIAEVPFFIQPLDGPEVAKVMEVTHNPTDLGKCPNWEDKSEDQYHVKYVSACGLSETESLAAHAFGKSNTLLDIVKALPRPQLTPDQWNRSGSQSIAGDVKKLPNLSCYQCTKVYSSFLGSDGRVTIWCPDCGERSVLVEEPKKDAEPTPKLVDDANHLACSKCTVVNRAWFLDGGKKLGSWCNGCQLMTEVDAIPAPKISAKNENKSWINALIPDRFKRKEPCVSCWYGDQDNCQFCGQKRETAQCEHKELYLGVCVDCNETPLDDTIEIEVDGSTPSVDMYMCEVCGKYDEFEFWCCGICGDSDFCPKCSVGHSEKGQEECRRINGA